MHAQVNTVYEKYMMSEKHHRRIEEYAPKTGTVRLLRLTEKQYDNIWYLTGGPDLQEAVVGKNGHILI
jgi:CRISPR-associated protein Cas2